MAQEFDQKNATQSMYTLGKASVALDGSDKLLSSGLTIPANTKHVMIQVQGAEATIDTSDAGDTVSGFKFADKDIEPMPLSDFMQARATGVGATVAIRFMS